MIHSEGQRLPQTPVSRKMGGLLQCSHNGLRKILSVGKGGIKMNTSRLGKTKGLLGQPGVVLSKKSTGYSTQSEEEALK